MFFGCIGFLVLSLIVQMESKQPHPPNQYKPAELNQRSESAKKTGADGSRKATGQSGTNSDKRTNESVKQTVQSSQIESSVSVPNGNETVEEYEHSYTEPDGTRVTKRIIIRRIKPETVDPLAGSRHKTSAHELINPIDLSEFQRACLEKHNEYREMHSSPPLRMSRELCKYAQEWADHLAHKHLHVHRPSPKKYGENIFWKMSPTFRITGDQPVHYWYDEVNLYDSSWYGGDPPRNSFKVSGHFTQLIWKETQYLGVGLAMNGTSFYVVANYHPIGNYFTRYGLNVLPPKTSADSSEAN